MHNHFNGLKTAGLFGLIWLLLLGMGSLIGGGRYIWIFALFGLGMTFYSYWNSDKMVLRMYNAQEVDERSAPEYYGIVRDLATKAGLPMPRVYVIDNAQPNAFATGRNPENAAVAASTGGKS